MASIVGVLFDVDGTLVDTTYLHAVTWWEALRQADRTVPMSAVHHAIGMGSDRILDALLGTERDRDGDAGTIAAHAALYADEVMLVGDSVWDVEAAARIKVPCIGVTCGGTSAEELTRAGAVAVFTDPADLLARWDDSPLKGS